MSATVGAHDGVTVIHYPPHGARWRGYWVECECGWIGPACPTEERAEQAHAVHVTAKTTDPAAVPTPP